MARFELSDREWGLIRPVSPNRFECQRERGTLDQDRCLSATGARMPRPAMATAYSAGTQMTILARRVVRNRTKSRLYCRRHCSSDCSAA
jgi:hypothetical protein